MNRKGDFQARDAYGENETVRFGEEEYRHCCKKATERYYKSLYWCSFAAMVLVAIFGLAALISADFYEKVSLFYAPMQFATVMFWAYANWQCYRHKVKTD